MGCFSLSHPFCGSSWDNFCPGNKFWAILTILNQQPWIPLCADTVTCCAWRTFTCMHLTDIFHPKCLVVHSQGNNYSLSMCVPWKSVSTATHDVQEQLISHVSSVLIILIINQVLILTQHTESHRLLLWPYQLPFDLWPFHTDHVLQDRRVSSHNSQGQPKNQCKTPSQKPLGQRRMTVTVSMGVRHQLIKAGVNGAGFRSSLESSMWDCYQAIKSIIFSYC